MGRFLLLLCTGALVVGGLSMGRVRQNLLQQDSRVSTFEADVIARENALSALNQAVSFVEPKFSELTSGHSVSTAGLARSMNVPATIQLASDGTYYDLLPLQPGPSDGELHAQIRRLGSGELEVMSVGRVAVSGSNGARLPDKVVTMKRTYSRSTPLDAALTVLSPTIIPELSGAFRVDGRDTDPTTLAQTGRTGFDRNGIRSNTTLVSERVGSVLKTNGTANLVKGVNGDGDIVTGLSELDLDAVFEEAYLHPSKQLLGSTVASATFGSTSAPAIVVATNGLTVTGTLRGTGVLAVNGDLEVTGELLWDGLLLVRKDPARPPSTTAADLAVRIRSGSIITGATVLYQGSSAFTMPFDARMKLTYMGSMVAWHQASVGIEYRQGASFTQQEIVPRGANRSGSVVQPYLVDFRQGQQIKFWVGVYLPDGFDAAMTGVMLYRNYGRGHFSTVSAHPYGSSRKIGPYTWRIGFEDLCDDCATHRGAPDWDYDDDAIVDQLLHVTLQCRAYDSGGSVVMSGGQPVYEDCTAENPDATPQAPVRLDLASLTSTSGQVSGVPDGSRLFFTLDGGRLYYSATSIARVVPLFTTLQGYGQLSVTSYWTDAS